MLILGFLDFLFGHQSWFRPENSCVISFILTMHIVNISLSVGQKSRLVKSMKRRTALLIHSMCSISINIVILTSRMLVHTWLNWWEISAIHVASGTSFLLMFLSVKFKCNRQFYTASMSNSCSVSLLLISNNNSILLMFAAERCAVQQRGERKCFVLLKVSCQLLLSE